MFLNEISTVFNLSNADVFLLNKNKKVCNKGVNVWRCSGKSKQLLQMNPGLLFSFFLVYESENRNVISQEQDELQLKICCITLYNPMPLFPFTKTDLALDLEFQLSVIITSSFISFLFKLMSHCIHH